MDTPLARIALAYLLLTLAGLTLARTGHGPAPAKAAGPSARRKAPSFLLITLVFLGAILAPRHWGLFPLLLTIVGLLAVWELARALGHTTGRGPRAMIALILLCYLPVGLIALLRVRLSDAGGHLAAFLYLCVAAHDAFAQLLGSRWGRRPLAPRLSPGKTVEGAFGGLAAAALTGAVLAPAAGGAVLSAGVLGLALGAAALGGDLLASAAKRAAGLKDFGSLLGPQGGVLDRFDGLLLAAVVMALAVMME